jgi:hypothetical protein
MSKRQDIIDALNTRWATITIANGYTFDLGSANIHEWRTTPLPTATTKALIFYDDEETTEEENELLWHDLSIVVNLVCNEGTDKAHTLRDRMQDVLTCFATILDVASLKATIKEAFYNGSTIEVDHQEQKETVAVMQFVIRYVTPLWEI